jgi:mRNA interferase RelE/StbE
VAEYRLLFKTSAAKELAAVGTRADRHRIIARLRDLSVDPRPRGCEKLAGYTDRYRIRRGNFRVVYLIDDARREVTVFKVADRKDVYR